MTDTIRAKSADVGDNKIYCLICVSFVALSVGEINNIHKLIITIKSFFVFEHVIYKSGNAIT